MGAELLMVGSEREAPSARSSQLATFWKFISFISLLSLITCCNAWTCNSESKDALLDFRQVFSDPNEKVFSSWDYGGDDCCTWNGVTCQDGTVIELDIEGPPNCEITRNDSYSGNKPPGASLAQLQDLQTLTIKYLQFSSKIPSEWGSFSALVSLTVTDCDLYGSIPSDLGNIDTLQHLDLDCNSLSGPICSSLCKLKSLTYLDLSSNDLQTSDIPACLQGIPTFRYGNQGNSESNSGNGEGGNNGGGGNGGGGHGEGDNGGGDDGGGYGGNGWYYNGDHSSILRLNNQASIWQLIVALTALLTTWLLLLQY
ncbi:hypothetical protein CY35_16G005000 [Sphagnum magellanicum]|nr:hypothetical protein CY35_16G005000 [Sphagnum magellanicum]